MSPRLVPDALRGYARDAAGAFRQAPLEVAVGIATAVAFSVMMRRHTDDTWWRVATAASLALPLLFGLSVLHARGVLGAPARWGASAAVLAALALYEWAVFEPDREAEGWRWAALLGAAVMALALVPAVRVADPGKRRLAAWRFDARLLARIVTVLAYGVVLYAALAGAVAAVSSLFDLKTPEHLYADLVGAVFFALVPWVVVGGLPELVAAPEGGEVRTPRSARLLGRYLYAPVLAVYLAILLAYTVKVLATGDAPKNLLSPIILLAGVFGFLGSVLLEPLRRDPEHTGVERLIRFFPALMLVLLPLAVWAVWVRTGQYGWTESRYLRFSLLLALGVLAALGTARLVRRREPVLLLVPAVLGGTLLLASFGPWGATAVSRRSQQARLREGLAKAGLLRNGKVVRPLTRPDQVLHDTLTLPGDTYERIQGSLDYLQQAHGDAAVQPLFASRVSGFASGGRIMGALRLEAGCPADRRLVYATATLPRTAPIPSLPAGTLYRAEGTREGAPQNTAPVRIRFTAGDLLVQARDTTGEWTARVDLRPLLARLATSGGAGCSPQGRSVEVQLTAEEARRPLVDTTGRARGVMVLTDVAATQPDDGPAPGRTSASLRLDRVEALVVVTGP